MKSIKLLSKAKYLLLVILFTSNFDVKAQTNSVDKPNVVIFRNTGFEGSLRKFPIYLDTRLRTKVKHNKYVRFSVEKGKHKLFAHFNGGNVLKRKYEFYQGEYYFENNQTYYFYIHLIPAFFGVKMQLIELSEREGKIMLENPKFSEQSI